MCLYYRCVFTTEVSLLHIQETSVGYDDRPTDVSVLQMCLYYRGVFTTHAGDLSGIRRQTYRCVFTTDVSLLQRCLYYTYRRPQWDTTIDLQMCLYYRCVFT